jgi:hypothetical protein
MEVQIDRISDDQHLSICGSNIDPQPMAASIACIVEASRIFFFLDSSRIQQ